MLKYGILLVTVLAFNLSALAQDKTFEKQTIIIAKRIDSIIISEKTVMKKSLEAIDKKLEKEQLNQEEATAEKLKIAEYHADRINQAVGLQEQKLQLIIKKNVNSKINSSDDLTSKGRLFFDFGDDNYINDTITGLKKEKRLTTQFVITIGSNTPIVDDSGYYGDGFNTSAFGFGEAGISLKYRMREESNLWNFKFGFSTAVYEISPKSDNDIAVTASGQTSLQDAGFPINKSRLTVGYLTIPLYLDLDFSKPKYDKNSKQFYLRSQQGVRMGIGGFFGVRYFTNQLIKFEEDGKNIRRLERDDFNVNTFTFGPSAYIGYRDVSIFARYDANPLFKNNPSDINNLSFGLRFDFN